MEKLTLSHINSRNTTDIVHKHVKVKYVFYIIFFFLLFFWGKIRVTKWPWFTPPRVVDIYYYYFFHQTSFLLAKICVNNHTYIHPCNLSGRKKKKKNQPTTRQFRDEWKKEFSFFLFYFISPFYFFLCCRVLVFLLLLPLFLLILFHAKTQERKSQAESIRKEKDQKETCWGIDFLQPCFGEENFFTMTNFRVIWEIPSWS